MSASICVLYIITGTFKSWKPKIRTPSCMLGCRCTCAWHTALWYLLLSFYQWARCRNFPRLLNFRGQEMQRLSVLHSASWEREERLQENCGDRVLVTLQKDGCLDLPLGYGQRSGTACSMWWTFLLEGVEQGMGFWKCSNGWTHGKTELGEVGPPSPFQVSPGKILPWIWEIKVKTTEP